MGSYNTKMFKQKRLSRVNLKKILLNMGKRALAYTLLALTGYLVAPNFSFEPIAEYYDKTLTNFDMKVEQIVVTGNDKIDTDTLIKIAGIKSGGNIMAADIEKAKEYIEQENWIAHATVERDLPDTIRIHVEEETPQAIYYNSKNYYLINNKGKIIEEIDPQQYIDYLMVIGKGGNLKYEELLNKVFQFQNIYKRVKKMEYDGQRRWDIHLAGNVVLRLPEHNIEESLTIFNANFGDISELNRICIIDLRLIPDKIFIKAS